MGVLTELNVTQSGLTRHLRKYVGGISTGTVSLICNYDQWPKGRNQKKEDLVPKIVEYLVQNDANEAQIARAFWSFAFTQAAVCCSRFSG